MKIFSLSLMVCVCVSCNTIESQRDVVERFPIENEIDLIEIEVEPVLYFIGDMLIVDNVLIALDMKNDTFFQFFNLPELAYLGGQINRGGGPEDEIAIFPTLCNLDDDCFSYRTMQKVKIASFDTVNQKIQIVQEIDIPDKYMNILNSVVMNNCIYGYDMLGKSKKEFIKYDPSNKTIGEFGPTYPIVDMEIEEDRKNTLFTKVMSGKIDGSKFASLYDKFPFLRIYNQKGEIIKEVEYKNDQRPPIAYTHENVQTNDMNQLTVNYMKIKTTDKYIYGLYSGKTHEELQTEQREINDYCKEVHVWDWAGEPVAKFILDMPVSSFAVASDDSYMLFYSFLHENRLYKTNIEL